MNSVDYDKDLQKDLPTGEIVVQMLWAQPCMLLDRFKASSMRWIPYLTLFMRSRT